MIGRLRGALVERAGAHIIIDCGGVGYEVTVSGYTLMQLPALGETVTLRVFTQAQENKIALYGFGTVGERKLFDLLITVKNVGPSSAMGILSGGASPTDIAQLIASGQVPALTKIKGVGKKTAELIVVELREKCELLLASWGASGEIAPAAAVAAAQVARSRPAILEDVASALVQLGFRSPDADRVVSELDHGGGATLESLLRDALRLMPR